MIFLKKKKDCVNNWKLTDKVSSDLLNFLSFGDDEHMAFAISERLMVCLDCFTILALRKSCLHSNSLVIGWLIVENLSVMAAASVSEVIYLLLRSL